MPWLPELTIRFKNLTLRKGVHKTEGVLDNWRHQGGARPLSQDFEASQSHPGAHAQHRNNNSKNKHLGVLVVVENMN